MTLWTIPWNNHNKETLCCLTVQGMSGASGHYICPIGPDPCGRLDHEQRQYLWYSYMAPPSTVTSPTSPRSYVDLNLHDCLACYGSQPLPPSVSRHIITQGCAPQPHSDTLSQASRHASCTFWMLLQDLVRYSPHPTLCMYLTWTQDSRQREPSRTSCQSKITFELHV